MIHAQQQQKNNNIMYNPYRRQPFSMSCFNLNTVAVKKKLQEFERQQRSEDKSSTLHRELTELKQTYQQDLSQHSNQLNKALQIIERQQNAISELRSNSNSSKTDEETFNKSVINKNKQYNKNNQSENEEDDDEQEREANSFENEVARQKHSSSLPIKSHSQHQRSGRKISFAPANSSIGHKSSSKNLRKQEEYSDNDDCNDVNDEDDDIVDDDDEDNDDNDSEYSEDNDEIDGNNGYYKDEVRGNKKRKNNLKIDKSRKRYEEDEESSESEDYANYKNKYIGNEKYKNKQKRNISSKHKIRFR